MGCGPSSEPQLAEGCFPENPREQAWQELINYVEEPGLKDPFELRSLQADVGFCEYGPAEYPPAFADYNPIEVNVVAACFDAGSDGSCDSCPQQDVEAEIRRVYGELQDGRMCPEDPAAREIDEIELGCVARLEIEGQWQCCFNAAIVSACNVDPGQSD